MTPAGAREPWPETLAAVLPHDRDADLVQLSGSAEGTMTLALRPVGAVRAVLPGGTMHLAGGPGPGLRLSLALPAGPLAARSQRAVGLDGPIRFAGGLVVPSRDSTTLDVMGMITLGGVTDLAVVRIGVGAGPTQDGVLVHARTVVSREAHGVRVPQTRARRNIGLSVRALLEPR